MLIIDEGIYFLEIDDTTACMNFNPSNKKYSKELINSSFERECKNLSQLKKYAWSPEIINIDTTHKKIKFKWYNNTAESFLPTDYKSQLEGIVKDLDHEHLYKPNFYPKCFYTDNNGIMHAFVFYSTSSYEEQPIQIDFYRPILNDDRLRLVERLSENGTLDMAVLISHAFNDYISWPGNPLPEIYKKVYE